MKKRPELNTIKANDWRSVQRFSEEVTEILQRDNPEWDLVIRDDSRPAPGKYIVDTRVKALRIIVPTGQALFAQIVLWDGWENANTNNVTITGSGVSETISTDGQIVILVHTGGNSWIVYKSDSPGGSDTQVQFNDGGSFAGSSDMTFDSATGTLTAKNISADDGEYKIKTGRAVAGNPVLRNYFFAGAGPVAVATPTGADNIGMGASSLLNVTSGYENVGLGNATLQSCTTGYQNTAIGFGAMSATNTGYHNIAIGRDALKTQTTGYENVAIGRNALYYLAGGYQNLAIGTLSMTGCTNGYYNVAIGRSAMFTLSTGIENIAIGRNSFYYGNGSYNTIIGTTAGQNATSCAHNTAIGRSSMLFVTSGGDNTAVGSSSLYSNQTGTYNVALGRQAASNMTGSQNTVLGATAGSSHGAGSGNVFIGYAVASSVFAGQSNILAIHNSNSATPLILGDFSTGLLTINGTVNAATAYQINGTAGADGSFTTVDGKTVTVTKGLITAIV